MEIFGFYYKVVIYVLRTLCVFVLLLYYNFSHIIYLVLYAKKIFLTVWG
jgi:hypothetical protein